MGQRPRQEPGQSVDSDEGSDSQEQGAGGDFAGDGAEGHDLEQIAYLMKNQDPFTL
jgi:hypothetical protein